MRKVMRIWAACVALALMISSTSLAVSDAVTLNMVKTQVVAGEVVDGNIDVQSDGVTNGMLTVSYDIRLELVSAEKNVDQGEDMYVSIPSAGTESCARWIKHRQLMKWLARCPRRRVMTG